MVVQELLPFIQIQIMIYALILYGIILFNIGIYIELIVSFTFEYYNHSITWEIASK